MNNLNVITIIGLGTLGGFVSQTLSEINLLKKLILIDFDIIEEKNIINSIYRKYDIGKQKTIALKEIINEQSNINIEIVNEKYIEGKTIIPKSDLVIDCRDFVCNRGNEIDIRTYISSRYLVVDCRKNIIYEKSYEGKYLSQLNKNDLRKAALILSSFIQDDFIYYMIQNQLIKEIDIDYLNKISNDIKNNNENSNIILDYDYNNNSDKFLNLEENIYDAIKQNKNKDILITLENKESFPLSKTIPKNTITNPNQILSVMTQMTKNQIKYDNNDYYYIISTSNDKNVFKVNLIPESGSA